MTQMQREMLTAYRAFHQSTPTLATLIIRFLRTWLLLLIVCGLIVVVGVFRGVPLAIGLGVGLFMGIVARDIGYALKTVSAWPMTNEIISWDRVEKLLNQSTTHD